MAARKKKKIKYKPELGSKVRVRNGDLEVLWILFFVLSGNGCNCTPLS